jgi:hypothetical protein
VLPGLWAGPESRGAPVTVVRARKVPVEVAAVQWTGENAEELGFWTGNLFDVLDEPDRTYCDDPEATAQVFDELHSTWVLVYIGDWIVRGVAGEFFPCRDSVFVETYERVDG